MEVPQTDLSVCEAKPIHLPDAIQPHGALLVLHGATLRITQATTTCETLLGKAPADLLDQDLATVLGAELADAVGAALTHYLKRPQRLASFSWRLPAIHRTFSGYVHQSAQLVVLELEPIDPTDREPDNRLACALAVEKLYPVIP